VSVAYGRSLGADGEGGRGREWSGRQAQEQGSRKYWFFHEASSTDTTGSHVPVWPVVLAKFSADTSADFPAWTVSVIRAWPWTAAPTVTAMATVYFLALSEELTRVPLNVHWPSGPAAQVCSCRASIAFSEVDTSVGREGAVVGGEDSDGGWDTAVVLVVDGEALGPDPEGSEPPPEHPEAASSKAAGSSSALFLIVPPEKWRECRCPHETVRTPWPGTNHRPWCSE